MMKNKDITPFYDKSCGDISLNLLSHLDLASSSLIDTKFLSNTWFCTNLSYKENVYESKVSFPNELIPDSLIKTKKIRLYPSKEQRILFKRWFGISRKFYNESVSVYNDKTKPKQSWMELAKSLLQIHRESYVTSVPYQVRRMGIKECYTALQTNIKKYKKSGKCFNLSYKSKKNPVQSCFIPKSALSELGIYHTISGHLRSAEQLPLDKELGDCRLVLENNRWFICIPVKSKRLVIENQADIVSLDPGIRSFITYFSVGGFFGQLGLGDFKKLFKLYLNLDKLISKRDLSKSNKLKYSSYNRAIKSLRFRIKNLISELHNKTVSFLVKNFGTIVYPTFRTKSMTCKSDRKLRSKSVRNMLSYAFYRFELKLEHKCKEFGRKLVRISEAYTSKTNSFDGSMMSIGSKEYFKYDGVLISRDINGARNILLRALRDSSALSCDT